MRSRDRAGVQNDDPDRRIPIVEYLVLDDPPYLEANECGTCGARFFGRRNACASCFGSTFFPVRISPEGTVRTFSIVAVAPPGVETPFVSALVDCDGTSVVGNLVNVVADPEHVTLGMRVRLATVPVGTDAEGSEAVGFGFEPMEVIG